MNNRQNENRSCFVDTVLFIAILACVCGFLVSEREVRASEPTETTSSTSETGNGTSSESSTVNTGSESSSSTSSTSSTASSSSSTSPSSSSSASISTSSSSSSVSTNVIHWNVAYTPIIKVNGIEDRTKSVSQYNYQVINNSGSAVSAVIPANNSPISGEITITGTLDSKYKIKLIGVVVDGNPYTPASDDTTSAYDPSTHTITGPLSPVINTTTRPSDYGNKLKATKVNNEDDELLEVSKIDEDLRNEILDYVYDNNVNNLKSVIQGIMSRGNELSLKVVAEKIDSSDADGKSDLKDEARKPSDVASKAEMLNYYNISIYITEGNSYHYDRSWNVTDTGSNNKLTLTFKVKSDSSSTSGKRYYKVLRYHGGDADSLTDYSTSTSIKIKSHKFSTYAVSYYDSSSSGSSQSASIPNTPIVPGGQGDDAGAGGTDKSKTPKTGDDFNPRIWIYLLIVCATVASAAWILLQDTREDNEKKQK